MTSLVYVVQNSNEAINRKVLSWFIKKNRYSCMNSLKFVELNYNSNIILSYNSCLLFTAGVLKKDESHLSPVVSLLPLVMPGDR